MSFYIPPSFVKNINSTFTNHSTRNKMVNGQLNNAVGMQKGKTLFTKTHQISPQPAIDQVTPARQNGDKLVEGYNTINKMSESLGTKHVEDVTPKPSTKFTTNIKDYPLNTRSRALEYERRGWAQDDTTRLPDGKVPAHSTDAKWANKNPGTGWSQKEMVENQKGHSKAVKEGLRTLPTKILAGATSVLGGMPTMLGSIAAAGGAYTMGRLAESITDFYSGAKNENMAAAKEELQNKK